MNPVVLISLFSLFVCFASAQQQTQNFRSTVQVKVSESQDDELNRFQFPAFQKSKKSDKVILDEVDINNPVPNNVLVPTDLDFTCGGKSPGFYTDPSPLSKCQVYHMCMVDGRKYSLLCGIGTVFNQRTFVCDHWYNYDCKNAANDHKLNEKYWQNFIHSLSVPKAFEEETYNENEPSSKNEQFQ